MAKRRENVKVKLIDTQYVETDSKNFKSVVQGLTGKNSSVEWIEESGFTGEPSKRKEKKKKQNAASHTAYSYSFKDLDMEIPYDELHDLLGSL